MIETVVKKLNQHVFINSGNKKVNDKFLKSTLTILDKYWHSVKPMPEAYLEPSQTSTIKFPCDFCKEAPT